ATRVMNIALARGRGRRSQPHQDQEPADKRNLRALPSHGPGRVLPDCVPQEDLSIYHTLEELQADLDAWLLEYNCHRPHQGRWCFGKTAMQTFLDLAPVSEGETYGRLTTIDRYTGSDSQPTVRSNLS